MGVGSAWGRGVCLLSGNCESLFYPLGEDNVGLIGLTCGDCSIHNLGLVGHIEDIVVNKDQQGKKLGLRIIEALDYIAEKVGCYKVSIILIIVHLYNPLAARNSIITVFLDA